jgi:hypothetical protein
MRVVVAILVGLVLAVVGPRLTSPGDRDAGAPFEYLPPEGFTEEPQEKGARAWTYLTMAPQSFVPKVSIAHVAARSTVEPPDLAKTAAGLPDVFADSGVTWTLRRKETRVRADGARVGLIEGDCVKSLGQEVLPGVPAEQHFRTMQLLFPDDQGTSVVKAYYGKAEASKWEAAFEATIESARGVATRHPPPPAWLALAWGVGGLVLGWLGASLAASRRKVTRERRSDAPA